MIEDFQLKIEYLRSAYGGSIIKKPIIKMTERSDIHKYSIFNFHYSILDQIRVPRRHQCLLALYWHRFHR